MSNVASHVVERSSWLVQPAAVRGPAESREWMRFQEWPINQMAQNAHRFVLGWCGCGDLRHGATHLSCLDGRVATQAPRL